MQHRGGNVPIGDVSGEGVSSSHPRPPEEDGDEDIGFVEVSVVVSEAAVISREDHQGIVEEARSSQCCHHPAHIAVSCLGGRGGRERKTRALF